VKDGSNKRNRNVLLQIYILYSKLITFRLLYGIRGEALSPTKCSGILMLVPVIFLIGGTFKSPELNAFPKFELLKTLLSLSRPWAPTSV